MVWTEPLLPVIALCFAISCTKPVRTSFVEKNIKWWSLLLILPCSRGSCWMRHVVRVRGDVLLLHDRVFSTFCRETRWVCRDCWKRGHNVFEHFTLDLVGAYDWAKLSLDLHRKDKREYLYSRDQLEQAKTHDPLWNAAQVSVLVHTPNSKTKTRQGKKQTNKQTKKGDKSTWMVL